MIEREPFLSFNFLQAFGDDDELRRTPSGARPLSSSEPRASSLSGRVLRQHDGMVEDGDGGGLGEDTDGGGDGAARVDG